MKNLIAIVFVILSGINACTRIPGEQNLNLNLSTPVQSLVSEPPTPTIIPTEKIEPKKIEEVSTPTVISVVETPTNMVYVINSPIVGIALPELSEMISNPFRPPKIGSDDPHQGVDFSDVDVSTNVALSGKEVQAIFSGQVVAVMNDRFPYGNAILIASGMNELPTAMQTYLNSLDLPLSWDLNTALTCPSGWNSAPEVKKEVGLYILYAHLKDPVEFSIGDQIQFGEMIGRIGMSGNALAPHLHVEMRSGYLEDLTGSMAHYDVSANSEEMSNYCRWRVSGWYRLVDPMLVLSGY